MDLKLLFTYRFMHTNSISHRQSTLSTSSHSPPHLLCGCYYSCKELNGSELSKATKVTHCSCIFQTKISEMEVNSNSYTLVTVIQVKTSTYVTCKWERGLLWLCSSLKLFLLEILLGRLYQWAVLQKLVHTPFAHLKIYGKSIITTP